MNKTPFIPKRPHTQAAIEREGQYGANNYHPLPVVLSRGEGVYVYDIEGVRYYDFLSAYSSLNQGHVHPRILEALITQAKRLTLTSRAYHSDVLGEYLEYMSDFFGFEKILPMNTGVEAVETAIKICRKWGYEKKGIEDNKALILTCEGGFHGRSTTVISFSTSPEATHHFGPYTPGFESIPYNDIEALSDALQHPNVAGFLVESIQGEAGVRTPHKEYMKQASALCRKHQVLLIADEIQTGLGRTGSLLGLCGDCTCTHPCTRQENYAEADIVLLGKALSGGFYPVSAVLANKEIMDVITPNTHGSTYGGNPLGCRVAMAALEVIKEEGLVAKARSLGQRFRERLEKLQSPWLKEVRGRGLFQALVMDATTHDNIAWELCLALKSHGLLAKPTHKNIIRLAPPLIITETQIDACCDIIAQALRTLEKKK